MAVEVRWVRYEEATKALAGAIAAAKQGDALAPVTVLVPTNHLGVAARRAVGSGAYGPVVAGASGLAATTFLTTARLAELLGAARLAGAGRRPVSAPVLGAATRAELAVRPGLFGPVAHHPATEAALVAAYLELRGCGPGARTGLGRAGGRAGAVVELTDAVHARVAGHHYDETDLCEAAAAAVTEGASGFLGPVIVHLPQRPTGAQLGLLAAVGAHHDTTVLAGTCGAADADDEVRAVVAALAGSSGVAPAVDDTGPSWPVDAATTRIVSASDADEEARIAVAAVVDAARDGTPLGRIAVLHAAPTPYARLLAERLDAAGLARNGAAVTPVAGLAAARTLLGALELEGTGWRRDDVFAWLAAAPVRDGGSPVPAGAWERISRDAGVVAGRPQWDARLTAHAARVRAAAASESRAAGSPAAGDGTPADDRRPGAEREAQRAEDLRRFVTGLADELADWASRPRRWPDHVARTRRLLDRLTGGARRWAHWPAPERTAAEHLEVALGRLEALDTVEGAVPLEVVARTLRLELESDLGRTGRLGEGVLVGPVGMALGVELDLVVIVGLAEGTFPSSPAEDALLPDADRARTGGALPLRSATRHRQHRQLRAVLAGSRRHVLTTPRGDLRRSADRVRSRWLVDIDRQLSRSGTRDWHDHVPSFAARLARPTEPATAQEARLAALRAALPDHARRHPAAVLASASDEVLRAGAEVVAARATDRLTRFDGLVGAELVRPLSSRLLSASAVERWMACPFAFFVHDELGARPVERPEERHRVSPADRGTVVHAVLEDFLTEVLEHADGAPEPDEAWSPEHRSRMAAIADGHLDALEAAGRSGRALYWRRERAAVHRDLDRWLSDDDAHRRRHGLVPVAAELGFGHRETVPPATLDLPDGTVLHFGGKADRLDRAADGSLVVTDYKTGKSAPYKQISAADPDAGATRFQLPIYALAARAHAGDPAARVRAEYLFASRPGDFTRIGIDIDDSVLEAVRAHLAVAAGGIAAGRFPARPDDTSTSPFVRCHACDPDALGTVELAAAWRRKRTDPALAAYATLVDPESFGSADDPTSPDGRADA